MWLSHRSHPASSELAELLPAPRRRHRARALLASALSLTLAITLAHAIPAPARASTPAPAPRPACPDSRPDRTSAAIAAHLCNGRVLVDQLTTEHTEVWALPDGTMSAEAHAGQVRIRDGANGWKRVDLSLQRRPDGSIVPKAHPGDLVLSGPAGAGDHDLAALGTGDDRVSVGWRGKLPTPVLSGTRATYSDVKPGVDLVIETTRTGFQTFLIVKSRAAAAQVASIAMPWRTGKLATRAAGRGLEVLDAAGKVRGQLGNAYMWDSRINPASGEPAKRVPLAVGAAKAPGKDALDKDAAAGDSVGGTAGRVALGLKALGKDATDLLLTPDTSFLNDPSTVYPVTIDPPIDILTTGGYHDTWVENTGGTGWNSTELKLGTWNGGGEIARSFLMFDVAPFYGMRIESATLNLYETWAYSCRDADWQLWTTGYADHTTNWSNQPPWLTYRHTSSQTTGYDACEADGWVSINAKDYFQAAADSYYPYNIIGLRAANESNSDSWKRFMSANSSIDPYVSIVYNPPPSLSNLATVPATSGCVTGAGRPWMTSKTPRLAAVASDADNQVSNVTFEWWVTGGSMIGSATVSTVASGVAANTDVPAGALADGGTYSWRVSAVDSSGLSSGWSAWCEFRVDSVKPNVPTAASTSIPMTGSGMVMPGKLDSSR